MGTVLLAAAYFTYGVAFSNLDRISAGLVAVALVLAAAGLFSVALISGREEASRRAMQGVLIVVLVALPVGLLSRLVGAALGAGLATLVTLNPPRFSNVFRNRLVAVGAASAYALALLWLIPPAGVMTGALVPPLAVGLADEFSAWRSR